jgi:PucR family transcriptional regulator, purine catabolism regulatory protein
MATEPPTLTVGDALALRPFARARLVGGGAGLGAPLRSVHVVDLPDAEYDWGREGVLLLTSGAGFGGDPGALAALVPTLAARGITGMVLSVGHTFDAVPPAVRAAADRIGFPLIETPPDVLFLDLTEAIYTELARRQHALLERSGAIHEQLTAVVLAGGGLDRLAATLASLLRRSVTVEDASMEVLATAVEGAVDDARERSVSRGQTSPEVAERLIACGLYERLRTTKTPQRVAPMPDLGMTMERIVAPIVVGDEIHGHLWIIAGDEPLTDLDGAAIRHGATVAALILLTEQARRDAADALRGDLLEDLLGAGGDPEAVAEHAHQLGVRVDRPHQVLLVRAGAPAGGGERALGHTLTTWTRAAARRGFTAWRREGLVWVLEAADEAVGRAVAEQIVADLGHPGRRLLVAVGGLAEPRDGAPGDLRRSYAQAREALHIAAALDRDRGVVAFTDLGLLHWLRGLPETALADNSYVTRLRRLVDEDHARGTDLLASLEAYLDHGGRLAEAAAALPVHRNTLLHRLRRIEERCGTDLRDPLERLQLHAAVKALRLHDRP